MLRCYLETGETFIMKFHLSEIQKATIDFFNLHWPYQKWGSPPDWGQPWRLIKANPAGNKQGVYALLNSKDEAIYIGVGASLGSGRYEGHGIGSRVGRCIRVAPNQKGIPIYERKYVPSPKWQQRGLSAIAAIGFTPGQAYLAYGLEAFLLAKFPTEFNKVRSARKSNI